VRTNPASLFFTNVADRLLVNAGYNFTTTNIQIWPTNFYTPAVHRLLQVAANIYDATTTRPPLGAQSATNTVQFPTVFRPLFRYEAGTVGGTVWINGYTEVTNSTVVLNATPRDLAIRQDREAVRPFDVVYGVPLVVGAKRGLPNFNEFAMQTHVQVLRKLQFLRSTQDAPPTRTNQMYLLGISNVFGIEAWNSYTNPFPRNLEMRVAADVQVILTNEQGNTIIDLPVGGTKPGYFTFATNMPVAANTWQGFRDPMHSEASFQIPLSGGFLPLPPSAYRPTKPGIPFGVVGGPDDRFENPSLFPVPRWWVIVNTKVRFILMDTAEQRIVDYVNLDSWEDPIDITETLTHYGQCGPPYTPDASDGSMWCTNRFQGGDLNINSPTFGIMNQISVGLGLITPPANSWNSFAQQSPPGQDRQAAIDFFRAQFGLGPLYNPGQSFYRSNSFFAPFVPVRNVYLFTAWNANDPLVHYTIGDLMESERTNRVDFTTNYSTIANLGRINRRYEPWGGNPLSQSESPTRVDLAFKDPRSHGR
jgi:hypothetical protein